MPLTHLCSRPALCPSKNFTKMPRAHFTGFGRTAPAVRGCLAPWGLFERFGPANGNAQRVNSRERNSQRPITS